MLTDGVVRLRPLAGEEDVLRAVAWYQDAEVLRFCEGPEAKPFDRARVERMYRRLTEIGELYMIDVATEAGWQTVGDVTLAPDTLPIVIGDPSWRSRGIGTRVLALLVARARALSWPVLEAKHIWPDNVRSRRLFQRHGFRLVAVGVDEAGRAYERYRLDLEDPLVIRLAAPRDADAILSVHKAAVEGLAGTAYDRRQVGAWVEGLSAAGYVQSMKERGEAMWVACHEGRVVGFCGRIAAEITALYVDPRFQRRGVGRALLQVAEASAWAEGHRRLKLDASLPSVSFYRERGYGEGCRLIHHLRDGTPVECLRMAKTLAEFPV